MTAYRDRLDKGYYAPKKAKKPAPAATTAQDTQDTDTTPSAKPKATS